MLTSGVFLSVCRQEWRAHNRYHIVVSAPALIVNLLKVLTWGPRASVPKWGALHMWACTLIRWELVQMQATEPTQRGLIRSFCSGTEDLHLWQGSQRCWDGWSRDHVWRTPGRCLRSCLLEFLLPGQSWRTRSQSLTAHVPVLALIIPGSVTLGRVFQLCPPHLKMWDERIYLWHLGKIKYKALNI